MLQQRINELERQLQERDTPLISEIEELRKERDVVEKRHRDALEAKQQEINMTARRDRQIESEVSGLRKQLTELQSQLQAREEAVKKIEEENRKLFELERARHRVQLQDAEEKFQRELETSKKEESIKTRKQAMETIEKERAEIERSYQEKVRGLEEFIAQQNRNIEESRQQNETQINQRIQQLLEEARATDIERQKDEMREMRKQMENELTAINRAYKESFEKAVAEKEEAMRREIHQKAVFIEGKEREVIEKLQQIESERRELANRREQIDRELSGYNKALEGFRAEVAELRRNKEELITQHRSEVHRLNKEVEDAIANGEIQKQVALERERKKLDEEWKKEQMMREGLIRGKTQELMKRKEYIKELEDTLKEMKEQHRERADKYAKEITEKELELNRLQDIIRDFNERRDTSHFNIVSQEQNRAHMSVLESFRPPSPPRDYQAIFDRHDQEADLYNTLKAGSASQNNHENFLDNEIEHNEEQALKLREYDRATKKKMDMFHLMARNVQEKRKRIQEVESDIEREEQIIESHRPMARVKRQAINNRIRNIVERDQLASDLSQQSSQLSQSVVAVNDLAEEAEESIPESSPMKDVARDNLVDTRRNNDALLATSRQSAFSFMPVRTPLSQNFSQYVESLPAEEKEGKTEAQLLGSYLKSRPIVADPEKARRDREKRDLIREIQRDKDLTQEQRDEEISRITQRYASEPPPSQASQVSESFDPRTIRDEVAQIAESTPMMETFTGEDEDKRTAMMEQRYRNSLSDVLHLKAQKVDEMIPVVEKLKRGWRSQAERSETRAEADNLLKILKEGEKETEGTRLRSGKTVSPELENLQTFLEFMRDIKEKKFTPAHIEQDIATNDFSGTIAAQEKNLNYWKRRIFGTEKIRGKNLAIAKGAEIFWRRLTNKNFGV